MEPDYRMYPPPPGEGDDSALHIEPSAGFVSTPYVQDLTDRTMAYLEAGYPVHLSGPSGTGKTTLAFHIAAQLGRPITLIHGDDEYGSSDLIGRNSGYRKSRVVDNYIHTVLKTEEEFTESWQDNRLTVACRRGHTLIYDEFTRSRPEANNALLSVLEERMLNLPMIDRKNDAYVGVHPMFRAIFTSNPEEYVGVHKTQDALMDRLITVRLSHFNRATEVAITRARSELGERDAQVIVGLVRKLRELGDNDNRPTIRACIAIARIISGRGNRARKGDAFFRQVCHDVLDVSAVRGGSTPLSVDLVNQTINKICDDTDEMMSGGVH